jgi:hypothetical protein
LLLRYLIPARPEPDPGIDTIAKFRLIPELAVDEELATVSVNFQFKTGKFIADSATVVKWINLSDREPVILLHVTIIDIQQQHYRFLALHDWMINNPSRTATLPNRRSVSFSLAEFHLVEPDGQNFLHVLIAEANRVLKKPRSLWRTRSAPNLPIRECDLFGNFGRVGAFEASAAALNIARREALLDVDAFHVLHNLWKSAYHERISTQSAELRNWLDDILTPPSQRQLAHELSPPLNSLCEQ